MGKKDVEKRAKHRAVFVAGCKSVNDIDEKKANERFDLMEKFAGYGFNRSHSAAYGWITYQTAWLKHHYPHEFMAGLISCAPGNIAHVVKLIATAPALGLRVPPPELPQPHPHRPPTRP